MIDDVMVGCRFRKKRISIMIRFDVIVTFITMTLAVKIYIILYFLKQDNVAWRPPLAVLLGTLAVSSILFLSEKYLVLWKKILLSIIIIVFLLLILAAFYLAGSWEGAAPSVVGYFAGLALTFFYWWAGERRFRKRS